MGSPATAQVQLPARLCADTESASNVQPTSVVQGEAYVGPGFVYLRDVTASVACAPRAMAGEVLTAQVTEAEKSLGLDVEIAIVLLTHPVGCNELYYIPIQNDILGIGYAKTNGVQSFDLDTQTDLNGVAFLNDIPYWERYPGEFRTAFLHEVGHRWGARIGGQSGGIDYRLTGREGGHWSYFLDSKGSPLEGNRFEPQSLFDTATPSLRLSYSPLDLYLMGLIEPDEVGPIRLLSGGTALGLDCAGHPVSAASPPQSCESRTLSGEWIALGITDVIAQEGERIPSAADAPRAIRTGVFVLGNAGQSWNESSCSWLKTAINDRFSDYEQATGGRMRLVNAVGEGLDCRALARLSEVPESYSIGGGCSVVESNRVKRQTMAWLLSSLLFMGGCLRRKRCRRSRC